MEHLHCFRSVLSRKFFCILISLNNNQRDREGEEGREGGRRGGGEMGEEKEEEEEEDWVRE